MLAQHSLGIGKSAIYTGVILHDRLLPKKHRFHYRIFMLYLDLSVLPTLFDGMRCWSYLRRNIAWFKRSDYYGDASRPLDEEIRNLVEKKIQIRPKGRICLLTHLRYFGFCFNPVSFYYCFDEQETLLAIVSHITNTPWGEDFAYVHALKEHSSEYFCFDKQFHVSPFMPMDIQYQWQFSAPDSMLTVHMENWRAQEKIFYAALNLRRLEWRAKTLNRLLFQYPFMSLKVVISIYWQALRLWIKRVPFYAHPNTQ